jgi:predicted transcriptional regulator
LQSTQDDRRRIAGDYLTRVRDDFERALRSRIYYVLLAHKYGMSNVDIGALLGISEAAVRGLIKRHGGDQ